MSIRSDPERGAKPFLLTHTGCLTRGMRSGLWSNPDCNYLRVNCVHSVQVFEEQASQPKEVGQDSQSRLLGVLLALRDPLPRSERVQLIVAI